MTIMAAQPNPPMDLLDELLDSKDFNPKSEQMITALQLCLRTLSLEPKIADVHLEMVRKLLERGVKVYKYINPSSQPTPSSPSNKGTKKKHKKVQDPETTPDGLTTSSPTTSPSSDRVKSCFHILEPIPVLPIGSIDKPGVLGAYVKRIISLINLLLKHGLKFKYEIPITLQDNTSSFLMCKFVAFHGAQYFTEIVQLLLENGYDVNRPLTNKGTTTLMAACRSNDPGILPSIKAMIKHAKVDLQDARGRTAMHYAAENDNIAVYCLLADSGADAKIKDTGGQTPRDLASLHECHDVLKFIDDGVKPDYISAPTPSTTPVRALKIVAVGDGAVGKTCMLIRIATGDWPGEYIPTVFDNYQFPTTIKGVNVAIQLWDTASREEYDRLLPLSFPQTDCFLLCFSLINRNTFERMQNYWLPLITHHCPDAPYILVGLKSDLRENAEHLEQMKQRLGPEFEKSIISTKDGKQMAQTIKAIRYEEISSLMQDGIWRMINKAATAALDPNRHAVKKDGCTLI